MHTLYCTVYMHCILYNILHVYVYTKIFIYMLEYIILITYTYAYIWLYNIVYRYFHITYILSISLTVLLLSYWLVEHICA